MGEQEGRSGRTELQAGRPAMPASYGIHAGDEGLLTWDAVSEWLESARNYWVATTRPDGRPHVAPVWGLWLDETFYFSTDPRSRKGRNLAANPEIVVHLESGADAVILEGAIEPVTETALLARFADAYDAKYHFRPDTSSTGGPVYAVRPRVVYAWQERDYVESATRWRFGG